MLKHQLCVVVAVFGIFVAACGGGGSGDDDVRPDGPPAVDAPDGGDLPDAPAAETCAAAELTPCTPSEGTSAATAILFEGTVLGPETLLCTGQVLVAKGGDILCVGADCASRPEATNAPKICADVISPGLIDAHSHLNYNELPAFRHEGTLWTARSGWQRDDDYHTFVDANYAIRNTFGCEVMKWAETRQILGGGTAALGSAGGACIDRLERNLDDTSASGLGTSTEYVINVNNEDTDALRGMLEGGGSVSIHVAEGIDGTSRSSEWTVLDRDMLVQPGLAVTHGTALSALQLADLGAAPGALVWSPRSNLDLYGMTSPVTVAKNVGLPIAIGTDWTPSGSYDIREELRCVDDLNRTYFDGMFSDRDLVLMATINGARALLVDDKIGRLAEGLKGDVTLFRGDRTRPYRAVLDAELDDVALVLIGGAPIYGDADVMPAIEPNAWCEALDVCGRARRICVKSADGTSPDKHHQTLTDIETALTGAIASARTSSGCTGDGCYMYELAPLFRCDAPPTCAPHGNGLPAGPSAGDGDGDGVDDATDVCPRIFDAPYGGASTQEDADGDGDGDACDVCPLAEGTDCAAPDPADVDGDGRANGDDNCPRVANPDQADGDTDGIGDVCDACPGVTTADCATIPVLRQPDAVGHPRDGATVTITGVVVTAIDATAPKGFSIWVQDPAVTAYGGLHVYFGSTALPAGLEVGDTVSVTGAYTEFYDESELEDPVVTITSTTSTAPAAIRASAAELATGGARAEELESMLVRVEGVSVVVANPDAPDDYDEVGLTAGLRMDDLILDGCDPNKPEPPAGCPANAPRTLAYPLATTFTSIEGILGWSFDARKIYPRTTGDIVSP